MHRALPKIWIITDSEREANPIAPIRRALTECPRRAVGVQLRAKAHPDRQVLAWARELRALTRSTDSLLLVNGRADLASLAEADGVHVPERGLPLDRLRAEWPALGFFGVSRHDRAGLREAATSGADFAFLSPVFDVPSKGAPIGIDGFSAAIAGLDLPTYALGGIRSAHLPALLEAGAAGVAVQRAIHATPDPAFALREMLDVLDRSTPSGE